ncbi:hypothetical protein MFIFM68171_04292 [Madurella fahalii]|uniref:Uncharacterized protein n=1 Tax=Madurella fahalii TaxID=1157608 RepID=A0ABQ0G8K1_9PEZI
MASLWSHILQRDANSGVHSDLTTGAIAGISCGAAALFLSALVLFIIYWRRLRGYDREDTFYSCNFNEREPPGGMPPTLTYTTDYKMDRYQEGDPGTSYTYSTEKPAYTISPPSTYGSASAMPTHPAYIPRAIVRGTPTPSTRSIASPTPLPPQFPSPGTASSKSQPDEAAIPAYINAAAAAPVRRAFSPPPYSGSRPRTHDEVKDMVLSKAVAQEREPNSSLARSLSITPRSKPLHGRENTTISGPLAFPEYYQAPLPPLPADGERTKWEEEEEEEQEGEGETDSRTFRNRVFSGQGEQQGQAKPERGRKRDKDSRHSSGGNRHYAEIEIGRGSDIW